MKLLMFISFIIAVLTGVAFCAIGKLLLRLRLAKIHIASDTIAENMITKELSVTDTDTKPPEEIVPSESKSWQSYTVKFEFSDNLGTIGVLLFIIGILTIVASLAVYVRSIEIESHMNNF